MILFSFPSHLEPMATIASWLNQTSKQSNPREKQVFGSSIRSFLLLDALVRPSVRVTAGDVLCVYLETHSAVKNLLLLLLLHGPAAEHTAPPAESQ